MRDDDGDLIYWFKMEEDDDGNQKLCVASEELDDDEDADSDPVTFTAITEKDFEYDGSFSVMCPQCASEECEYINGDIVQEGFDDGWIDEDYDPFSGEEEDRQF
jgi:hypothetical protein